MAGRVTFPESVRVLRPEDTDRYIIKWPKAGYPPHAIFYPNQSSYIPIEICGLRINATQDLDAFCHENRHFLDFALWRYLKEGNPRIGEVIGPHPPCKKIEGTKADDGNIVVGMLRNTIKVTLLNVTKDSEGRIVAAKDGIPVYLQNVLLVENLPVPVHIGTKASREIYTLVKHGLSCL